MYEINCSLHAAHGLLLNALEWTTEIDGIIATRALLLLWIPSTPLFKKKREMRIICFC